MTGPQWDVLQKVVRNSKGVTAIRDPEREPELASVFAVLERKGLVRSMEKPRFLPARFYCLTPAGKKAAERPRPS